MAITALHRYGFDWAGLRSRRNGVWADPWKWLIKRYSTIHIQGEKPNVFIFATSRTGSTWVMEMIATQPGIKYINSPLLPKHFRHPRSPFPSAPEFLLPHPGREARLERYFQQLLENRLGIGSPAPFSRFHRFVSRRLVVKLQSCHDLMNWFEAQFQAQIIYLVRHPIATNLSRQRCPLLPFFLANGDYCRRYLTPALRAYGQSIWENGSDLQKKVLDWCLQNLPPLKFLDRSRWLCLHYEDLVMNPRGSIDKMADFLGLSDREKMYRQVSKASSAPMPDAETRRYVEQTASTDDRTYLVNKWRKKISADEEAQLFAILRRFDLDVYEVGHDLPTHRL